MRRILLFSLFFFAAETVYATDCANQVAFDAGGTFGQVFVTYDANCGQTIDVAKGDTLTISDNTNKIVITVTQVKPFRQDTIIVAGMASGTAALDKATLEQFKEGDTVTVAKGDASVKANVAVSPQPGKVARYNWSIGPASKESADNSGTSTTAAASTATTTDTNATFRFKYDGEYAAPGFFGSMAKNPNVQTAATLSIDTTTTNNPGYIDNNRGTFGVRYLNPTATPFFAQVNLGGEARVSKAAHSDVHDIDAVATFSTWIPALPAITLLGSGPKFIAPPLSVALSYGYRNKHTADENLHGRVGEATANYYFFAAEKYMVSLGGTWTLNDLPNRPATVKRTQRLYKAEVSYLADPAKGFEVAMSYENGSIGPVLTKVKQYFIGMALKNFSLSGGSK